MRGKNGIKEKSRGRLFLNTTKKHSSPQATCEELSYSKSRRMYARMQASTIHLFGMRLEYWTYGHYVFSQQQEKREKRIPWEKRTACVCACTCLLLYYIWKAAEAMKIDKLLHWPYIFITLRGGAGASTRRGWENCAELVWKYSRANVVFLSAKWGQRGATNKASRGNRKSKGQKQKPSSCLVSVYKHMRA